MKHMIPKTYRKQIIPLCILLITACLIWLTGSYISWLAQPERRFFLICFFCAAWFIKFMFFDIEHAPAKTITTSLAPEVQKRIQTLQGRFDGAMNFLKKTIIQKNGKNTPLSQLPWYLVIGSPSSGKTTLLHQANVNFILSKQPKPNTPSVHCDWWATRDLVLVDVPGTIDATLWNSLTDLIKKNGDNHMLNGVIITLHLPEIMKKHNSQQKKQILSDIKQRITHLRSEFGTTLPFYLIITKCDLLPGFSEYFSDCGTDELNQAWGITLPPNKDHEKVHETFSHRFNALIKRINKQLIWRLHQERNANARSAIKDFPLQVERLKESITHFLKALMTPDLRLQGVYLTSATQSQQDESAAQPTLINPAATQALQLAKQPSMPERAYFIRQVILQGLLNTTTETPQQSTSRNRWQHRSVYAAAVSAVLISALLLGRDFQISVQQAYSLQNDLTKYQLYIQQADSQDDHISKALPLLDALQKAAAQSNYSLSRFANILSFYSHKSQKAAETVYAQALQTIVLPEIKNYLENYLQNNTKNSAQIYMALKAYLMLGDTEHLQPAVIINTINQLMPNALDEKALTQFFAHANALFTTSWQPIALNTGLVAQVRQQLNSLSASELSFIILKSLGTNNEDITLDLGNYATAFASNRVTNKIPKLFTADALQPTLTTDLLVAATETLQGNWILGTSGNLPNQPVITALAEQLRIKYLNNYVDIWESLLANIQLSSPTSLAQMDQLIAELASNNSPLLQLFKTIRQNTAFEPILNTSPKLQALNRFLTNDQENMLNPVLENLHQIDFYLQNILHNGDSDKAIIAATKNYFNNPSASPLTQLKSFANQTPEPLRNWLQHLADQTTKLLLQETGQSINTLWKNEVSTVYRNHFSNRYPFDQNATQEVSLSQFVNFMGQPGTLNNFYQTYLKSFITETDKKWQWKTVDNQRLPFSNTSLEIIQHAMQIQHAFFPNGDNKLYVQFALEPINLDARTKNFNLTINGQQIRFQKEKAQRILTWPGTNNLHATTINFVAANNENSNNTYKGDWGWFRLVTQSTKQIISPKQLQLEFNNNGHSAKYMLYTQSHMNPFLPLNLERFELPATLS